MLRAPSPELLDPVRASSNVSDYQSTDASLNDDSEKKGVWTVDDAVEKMGYGIFQVKILFIAGLSWMADSLEMTVMAILGPTARCVFLIPTWQEALLSTIVFVGMMLSSSTWGKISDKYGRRPGIVMSAAWIFYYGFLSAFSPSYTWILVLRFFVGVGVGGLPQVVTLYAEFLPGGYRAQSLLVLGIFWGIGGTFEVLLALTVMPGLGWRWLLALSSLPLLLFVITCRWLPESPHYFVSIGENSKALKVLEQVSKDNKKSLPEGSLSSVTVTHKEGKFLDLVAPQYLRTTLLLWMQWFGGMLIFYGILLLTPELFEKSDCHKDSVHLLSSQNIDKPKCGCKMLSQSDYIALLWTTLADLPGLLFTLLLIDRIGRIKTLAIGLFNAAFFFCMLYICAGRIFLTFSAFAIRFFIVGATQVLFIYTPEVYPTEVRGLALGTCSGMARVGCIVTPFLAQVLISYSMNLTIGVYALVSFLCFIAALLLPIETKGRALDTGGGLH